MNIANKIDAKDKKLSEVLTGQRYRIEMFQREYRWQYTQLEALISDLSGCFMKSYKAGDEIEDYVNYDSYYMGPIVLCQDEHGDLSIIDGQQRLTTFTILLIFLSHLQDQLGLEDVKKKDFNLFFYVKKGGKRTLVLNVEERIDVMETLIRSPKIIWDETFANSDNDSVQNIVSCYRLLESLFPPSINNVDVLPIFIEWLLDKVVLVEVRAYSMENAYTIFETMNDRGLSLNPTEMLKGYILSKIVEDAPENEDKAEEANVFWNERLHWLKYQTQNENEMDFFRAWLRGRYADTKRQRIKGAENEDFERIGTQYHSWVKNNAKRMGLKTQDDFYYFIRSDFEFYSGLYEKIFSYKGSQTSGMESLFFNQFYSIADSLSLPLFVASVSKIDNGTMIEEKVKLVGGFIDKLVNIRTLQQRSITQSSIRDLVYEDVLRIRNKSIEEQESFLNDEIKRLISSRPVWERHHPMNNWGYYHYFLARILFYLKPCDDFSSLLRSRKQSSLILCPVFSEWELQQIDENGWESYAFSVANYFLIPRKDYRVFQAIERVDDKLVFLKQNHSIPEIDDDAFPDNPFELMDLRDVLLDALVRKIWCGND